MTDLFRAYFDPEKHAKEIPVERVVSDEKVDEDHIIRLGDSGLDPAKMRPIVVIKHPKVDAYAVLDGHHRFHIVHRMGEETIRAAVVDDYVGLGFYLTKKGVFQPTPEFTKYIRIPLKRFVWWMTAFLNDPFSAPKGPPEKDPKLEAWESNRNGLQQVETNSGPGDERGDDMTEEVRFEMSEKRTIACVDRKGPYGDVVAGALGQLAGWAGPKGIVRGPPLGIYYDSPNDVAPEDLRCTLGFPVQEGTKGEGDIRVQEIEPRQEAVLTYKGPYEKMPGAYNRMFDAVFRGGYRPAGPIMEIYISDPHETAPEELLTEIRMPVERA